MHSGVEFVVKNVTEELKATGLWANTVFVLTGDNGGTAEHGMPVPGSSNFPLRGHKYSWFEGGVRTQTPSNYYIVWFDGFCSKYFGSYLLGEDGDLRQLAAPSGESCRHDPSRVDSRE